VNPWFLALPETRRRWLMRRGAMLFLWLAGMASRTAAWFAERG